MVKELLVISHGSCRAINFLVFSCPNGVQVGTKDTLYVMCLYPTLTFKSSHTFARPLEDLRLLKGQLKVDVLVFFSVYI